MLETATNLAIILTAIAGLGNLLFGQNICERIKKFREERKNAAEEQEPIAARQASEKSLHLKKMELRGSRLSLIFLVLSDLFFVSIVVGFLINQFGRLNLDNVTSVEELRTQSLALAIPPTDTLLFLVTFSIANGFWKFYDKTYEKRLSEDKLPVYRMNIRTLLRSLITPNLFLVLLLGVNYSLNSEIKIFLYIAAVQFVLATIMLSTDIRWFWAVDKEAE
ncbi:MAG: hypothetical protein U5L04_10425 [Trueperaceae bacterium]|nr:hypothetical protein [Trueperaceae bacterium]